MRIQVIDEQLSSGCIRIIFEEIQSFPGNCAAGMPAAAFREFPQPGGVRAAVIVGECQEFSSRLFRSGIPRRGSPFSAAANQMYLYPVLKRHGYRFDRRAAAVNHYNDFQSILCIVLTGERIKTLRQRIRAVIRRNNHRKMGHVRNHHHIVYLGGGARNARERA